MPRGAKPKIYPEKTVMAVRALYANGHTQHEIAEKRRSVTSGAKTTRHGRANEAGKQALHRRLYSRFGKPSKCSVCGTEESKHYDYANLTGRYEDLDDYTPMCRSCHWKYDEKINNIRAKGGMSNAEA